MRARLLELRERRVLLVVRAQAQREHLAVHLARADEVLDWLQRMRDALAALSRRPLVLGAGALLILALRPRRVFRLLASGWSVWQLYRRAQRWLAQIDPAGRTT